MIKTIPPRMIYECNICEKEILNNVVSFEGRINTSKSVIYSTPKNFGDHETHHFHKSCLIRRIEEV